MKYVIAAVCGLALVFGIVGLSVYAQDGDADPHAGHDHGPGEHGMAAPETADAAASPEAEAMSQAQKESYVMGVDMGRNMVKFKEDLLLDEFLNGFAAGFKDEGILFSDKDIENIRQVLMMKMRTKQNKARSEAASKAKDAGKEFLAENGKKDGVITTASGLQYMVIKEGEGDKPKATDKVTVHYKGTLLDGSEFDSSYKRNQPASFPLNGVIPGWTEGLQLMSVGAKYTFFIPSELGYGERGAGQRIPPHSVLIFEVELLGINQ